MSEVTPPDLDYDFIAVHWVKYLALHTHEWMNQNEIWNFDPYLNPWTHHLLFELYLDSPHIPWFLHTILMIPDLEPSN